MLRPSYTELMEILNKASDVDSKITSRYTIVIAVAKRARQLIDGADPLTYAITDRAVSTAVKEMQEGMIDIKLSEEFGYNMLSAGMAYTDYEGAFSDDVYQNKKTIDYVMDKSDREMGMMDFEDGHDEDANAYDHDDEDDLEYEADESDYEGSDENMEQDYQDEDQ